MKKIALLIAVVGLFATVTAETSGLIKTRLTVIVLNKLGNPVKDAIVKIYLTKEDYQKKENEAATSQFTNASGKATFKGLEPTVYYIYAVKGDEDNKGSGFMTDTLEEFRINQVRTIIADL